MERNASSTTTKKVITAFASKSEEKRHKSLRNADSQGLESIIHIFPIANSTSFGVAVRLDGHALKSKLCADKNDILKFLAEIL